MNDDWVSFGVDLHGEFRSHSAILNRQRGHVQTPTLLLMVDVRIVIWHRLAGLGHLRLMVGVIHPSNLCNLVTKLLK